MTLQISNARRTFTIRAVALFAGAAGVAYGPPMLAQSAQPFSVQVAASYSTLRIGNRSIAGVGIAPQLRYNRALSSEQFGTISLGVGAEYSLHRSGNDDVQVVGLFVEPRWALPFSAGCV